MKRIPNRVSLYFTLEQFEWMEGRAAHHGIELSKVVQHLIIKARNGGEDDTFGTLLLYDSAKPEASGKKKRKTTLYFSLQDLEWTNNWASRHGVPFSKIICDLVTKAMNNGLDDTMGTVPLYGEQHD